MRWIAGVSTGQIQLGQTLFGLWREHGMFGIESGRAAVPKAVRAGTGFPGRSMHKAGFGHMAAYTAPEKNP